MEAYDYEYAQEVARRIARMTPKELQAYSERIASKTALPTTPERVKMVLQAIPVVLKDIENDRKQNKPLSYVCEDCGVTMPHNVTLMDGHFRCEWCHIQARAQQSKESQG